ncbi:uncharacterized protein Tco025E_04395 [Trypanosoma conorhini]|uniref:Uncharacterized protein n=1 Tax=Trypanosoma conorhini TaxID=83891 RepID=A0A3R7L9C5_9TRYP|nr:uncharacterized protein Tco025E_04395 [Trypanosoma conorhini]RNF18818.1 hypothetical protein Tco025E_04395 [Trypanosoma conorhini]
MHASTAQPPPPAVQRASCCGNLGVGALRRQPCVDVVELDEPSVYTPSSVRGGGSLPPTPQPLAVLREEPTHEPRRRKSSGDRDRFQPRKVTSWTTTTTTTTVSLPPATVVIRAEPGPQSGSTRSSLSRDRQNALLQSLLVNEPPPPWGGERAASDGGRFP